MAVRLRRPGLLVDATPARGKARNSRRGGLPPSPRLHHLVASRLAVGTLPFLACYVALVLRDLLELWAPGSDGGAARMLPAHAAFAAAALLAGATILFALRVGGSGAAVTVAYCAALLHTLLAAAALDAVALVPLDFCPASVAGEPAACADVVFRTLLAPMGGPFLLALGLPPRYALPLELLRLGACAVVVLALVAATPEGIALGWAARYLAKSAAVAAASPVVMRAALGPDHPRELSHLQLCPRSLRRVRNALLALGARLAAVSWLEAAPAALLFAQMAHFTSMFARHMLRGGAAQGWLSLAAWAVATGAGLWRATQLHRRRAARHARSAAAHSVHALHLQLSQLDDDPETLLVTAADMLLAAFPPGCSIALAEWPASGLPLRASADSDGSSVTSLDGGSNAAPWQAASAPLAMPQEAAAAPSRSLSVLRVLARSPRASAAAALDVAARRGCARRGSAAAALAMPGSCAGLTLDADDFAEGAEAFADWYVRASCLCSTAASAPSFSSSNVACFRQVRALRARGCRPRHCVS
jgi:hypothetical protein